MSRMPDWDMHYFYHISYMHRIRFIHGFFKLPRYHFKDDLVFFCPNHFWGYHTLGWSIWRAKMPAHSAHHGFKPSLTHQPSSQTSSLSVCDVFKGTWIPSAKFLFWIAEDGPKTLWDLKGNNSDINLLPRDKSFEMPLFKWFYWWFLQIWSSV